MTVENESGNRKKVLFFAEGATLAHVVRPLLLAKSLDPARFDIAFCRPTAFSKITDPLPFRVIDLRCQDALTFARRLEKGAPLYDLPTLKEYVREDMAIIEDAKPDVIVGDFRLSLSVSARLEGVPYVTLCDAYWSPEYPLEAPLPVLLATKFVPVGIAQWAFRQIAPLAFRLHSVPMERLRRHFGLPSLNHDLRTCYTDADLRLFANPSPLFPEIQTSSKADFLGPIAWSPHGEIKLPATFRNKPLIYLTMGSSGAATAIPRIFHALKKFDCCALVATAGRKINFDNDTVRYIISDYFPGDLACNMADLVICNGGSPTTNQALNAGKPVIGIAQNMDQFLNMRAIERHGSGLLLRADRLTSQAIDNALEQLLRKPDFRQQANSLKTVNLTEKATEILVSHIDALTRRR